MTLIPHSPAALDNLALRLLDVAALVRKMANSSRENGVEAFQLHGNKVQEWLGHLEEWAYDGTARLDAQIMRERGARRSRETPSPAPRTLKPKRVKRGRRGR